jgi:hydrogenase nickel incorporation protein HypA/HybF
MHEMSLAEGVLQLVEDGARANAATGVTAVWLEIGALAQVEVEALRFCFDAVTRGTIADGARLEIVTPPGLAWCMPCGNQVPVAQRGDACPHCGSHQLQVVRGDEMRVTEIEIA